jgi:FLVCR family feline leukemia virus subgroup C receptor-related protein
MFMYGVYTCLGAIINDLVSKFGFKSTDSSIMGACFIISGLVGSFIFSGLLDKHKKYLLQLRVVCFFTLGLFCFSFVTLKTGSLLLVSINISIVGFFLLPIIPLGFGFSIELTYPVSEAMSNGVIMLFSQIVGSLVTYLASWLCSINANYCLLLFFTMMVTASLSSLMITEDLRRINMTANSK